MSLAASDFLDEERAAFRPFEALVDLTDEQLRVPVAGAHGWSGRQLMAHLLSGHEMAIAVAAELVAGETSPAKERADADWDTRGGDVVNAEIDARWAALSMAEVRTRFATLPEQLRSSLVALPGGRWLGQDGFEPFFRSETTGHYADHVDDLAAILAADPDAADRWWRDGVVYQVYPRSFADSNGDGVGDIPGIIDHLDHLAGEADSLGIDAVWLSPVYPSPMLDGGYDVVDHTTVDPVFGTMADLDRLVEACHRRRIRVILDLVMNHTSSLHPWFAQSRQSRRGPFADFYLWRDPSGWDADGVPEPPNNWLSWFGGSAWAWEPQREQFYLHTFLPEQPDVNWRCLALRTEMWSMVRGWLDRGVDGFRLDVFNAFVKAAEMPSNPELESEAALPWDSQEHRYDKDQPALHEVLADFRRIVDSRPGTATVGELFASGIEAAVSYWAPRHLVFDWVLLETPWSAGAFRSAIADREAAWAGRWPTTVLSNHDRSRHVSRYLQTIGRRDPATADAVAKAAATIELTLRGTPFLYYGEEIGATDITVPRRRARDRAAERMPGWWNRDGCRAPMAWSGETSAGFTSGQPWLPIPRDAASRNVERQRAAEDSVLGHYRRLLALRRGSATLRTGDLTLVDVGDPDVLAYLRRAGAETMLVAVRFGLRGGEIDLPPTADAWTVVLSSHDRATPVVGSRVALRPLEAIVFQSDAPTIPG